MDDLTLAGEGREIDEFLAAGAAFVALCERLPAGAWERPALGSWDLRALVGHTLRAVTTVREYLAQTPPDEVTCGCAAAYFVAVRALPAADDAAVAARGVQAGADLGADPAATAAAGLARTREALAEADPDRLVVTAAGGMQLSAYLPTRTFELAAHSLDVAAAVGPDFDPALPPSVLVSAAATAAQVAALSGDPSEAAAYLRHLLGRPDGRHRPMFGG